MGCDIHAYVEKREDGVWRALKGECPYYKDEVYVDWIYGDRNYHLFSMLADVRNSKGIVPISDEKGLPDDVDPIIEKEANEWSFDGHSHSYITLKELEDYPYWNAELEDGWTHEKKPFFEYVESFIVETIPKLKEIAAGDSSSVRMVFWFDN